MPAFCCFERTLKHTPKFELLRTTGRKQPSASFLIESYLRTSFPGHLTALAPAERGCLTRAWSKKGKRSQLAALLPFPEQAAEWRAFTPPSTADEPSAGAFGQAPAPCQKPSARRGAFAGARREGAARGAPRPLRPRLRARAGAFPASPSPEGRPRGGAPGLLRRGARPGPARLLAAPSPAPRGRPPGRVLRGPLPLLTRPKQGRCPTAGGWAGRKGGDALAGRPGAAAAAGRAGPGRGRALRRGGIAPLRRGGAGGGGRGACASRGACAGPGRRGKRLGGRPVKRRLELWPEASAAVTAGLKGGGGAEPFSLPEAGRSLGLPGFSLLWGTEASSCALDLLWALK